MIEYTVKLQWLELVWPFGASSTHRWVRATYGVTIFEVVHVYFMFPINTMFFYDQSCKGHVTSVIYLNLLLCKLELKL